MTPDLVAPHVHRFEKQDAIGWSLNMLAVSLPDRGLLLYSPAWLGPGTFEAVDALGEVRVLVAPNHFHHLSLPRYRERYPNARAVASRGALPRLEKKGHAGLQPLSDAASHLPPDARFIEPEGLKNGEAWLSLPGEGGRTWLVCDAWFHVNRPLTGFPGLILRALRTGPGLCVGATWRMLAVRDRAAYVASARGALDRERPSVIVPSHGDPVREGGGSAAHERARAVLDARLG